MDDKLQAMDRWASEGALDGTSVGSVMKWKSDGWYERWIRQLVEARRMVGALDQGASEGAMDGTSDGWGNNRWRNKWYKRWISEEVKEWWMGLYERWISEKKKAQLMVLASNIRSDGWYKRWIMEKSLERWMAQALDQWASGGALDGTRDGFVSKRRSTFDGSGINRRNDGWYKRWIGEQLKER